MRRARGFTIIECVVALSLAIVLLFAAFPPLHRELDRLQDLREREAARLLVEGELARAREDAARGKLAPGAERRATDVWTSAQLLPSLAVERRVTAREGLLEVAVSATWRSRAVGAAKRTVSLATWVSTR